MYFWKTNKLSNEIKENTLTENDWKQYYLAVSILLLISIYSTQLVPRINIESLIVEGVLSVAITVIGINITFKTNQNNNGTNFIARITALSFPIAIKIATLSFLYGIGIGVAKEMLALSTENKEWATTIFTVLIQVLFFWRINVHLKYINTYKNR